MYETTVYLCSRTNSTLFTKCCSVAICEDELLCPKCKKKVIGYDEKTKAARHRIRWNYAYRYYK